MSIFDDPTRYRKITRPVRAYGWMPVGRDVRGQVIWEDPEGGLWPMPADAELVTYQPIGTGPPEPDPDGPDDPLLSWRFDLEVPLWARALVNDDGDE